MRLFLLPIIILFLLCVFILFFCFLSPFFHKLCYIQHQHHYPLSPWVFRSKTSWPTTRFWPYWQGPHPPWPREKSTRDLATLADPSHPLPSSLLTVIFVMMIIFVDLKRIFIMMIMTRKKKLQKTVITEM